MWFDITEGGNVYTDWLQFISSLFFIVSVQGIVYYGAKEIYIYKKKIKHGQEYFLSIEAENH